MLRKKMGKSITVFMVLVMLMASFGASFALDAETLFKDPMSDPKTIKTAEDIVAPVTSISGVGSIVLGVVMLIVVFLVGGKEFILTIIGSASMGKARFRILIVGVIVGLLFISGGIFDSIGLLDKIFAKPLEDIMNS